MRWNSYPLLPLPLNKWRKWLIGNLSDVSKTLPLVQGHRIWVQPVWLQKSHFQLTPYILNIDSRSLKISLLGKTYSALQNGNSSDIHDRPVLIKTINTTNILPEDSICPPSNYSVWIQQVILRLHSLTFKLLSGNYKHKQIKLIILKMLFFSMT